MLEDSTILIRNIFHMLCYAFKILRQQNYQDIETEEFTHVEDMLAAILSRGINQQLKQGLYRDYISVEEQSKTLRGKVNPLETRLLQMRRLRQFDCIHDEFSPDVEFNQILKATCVLVLRSKEIRKKQKDEIRRIVPFFSSVSDIDLSMIQWGRLQYHRNNRSYEMLMNICYMIWQSLLPSVDKGKTKFSLFDEESLPRLYEKFILEYYRQHFPMLHASDKRIQWDIPEETDQSMIKLLPGMHSDITLRHNGKTLIIDAKFYKHSLATFMEKRMIHSANLYQIFTYVKNEDKTMSGNVSGLLLYARTTEEIEPHLSVVIGGNQISVQTLDLNRPFKDISMALDSIPVNTFGKKLHGI